MRKKHEKLGYAWVYNSVLLIATELKTQTGWKIKRSSFHNPNKPKPKQKRRSDKSIRPLFLKNVLQIEGIFSKKQISNKTETETKTLKLKLK